MKTCCFVVLFTLFSCLNVQATSYNSNMTQGITWLTSQQNSDGSWGSNPNLQLVYTSVAVQALARTYITDAAYYAGVTWLEDHAINNVDLISRSSEALISHGDSLGASLTYLNNDQYVNNGTYAGWGLNGNYTTSTLDTALALIAIKDLGTNANLAAAVTFLQTQQGTTSGNQGWTINSNSNTTSDLSVTAIVIQALAKYTGTYSVSTNITNGLNTLNSQLTSASPPIQLALAAQAAQDAGNATLASTFLNNLVASQGVDGSWSQDPYITAVATRAIATNVQAVSQSTIVPIIDQNLQTAINQSLGRNAMDSLTLGLMAQLTTLNAVGAGISNLSGLQNAVNLKTVNLNNNNLTSISAISSLTAATVTWYNNPGNPTKLPGSTQVPALPPLAMLILAVGLWGLLQYFNRKAVSNHAGLLCCLLAACVLMVSSNNTYAQTPTNNGSHSLPAPATTLSELRAQGLPAEKLQIIQQIGGNILQAKRTATVESGDRDLLSQVQATVANLLKIERQGVGNVNLSASAQSQQMASLKQAQSAAWDVVATLRQEGGLLQGAGNKSPKKQILSGGKQVGEQRGRLYTLWANQLDNILGNQDTSVRLKQLRDLNNQLQPVTSITKRLDNPGSTPKMHVNSRL